MPAENTMNDPDRLAIARIRLKRLAAQGPNGASDLAHWIQDEFGWPVETGTLPDGSPGVWNRLPSGSVLDCWRTDRQVVVVEGDAATSFRPGGQATEDHQATAPSEQASAPERTANPSQAPHSNNDPEGAAPAVTDEQPSSRIDTPTTSDDADDSSNSAPEPAPARSWLTDVPPTTPPAVDDDTPDDTPDDWPEQAISTLPSWAVAAGTAERPAATGGSGSDDTSDDESDKPTEPTQPEAAPPAETAEKKRPKRRLLRRLRLLLAVVIVAASIAPVVGAISGQYGLLPVETSSMNPDLNKGDLVLARPAKVSTINEGDIIVFRPPGGGKRTIHAVHSINTRSSSSVMITTKGTANSRPDPWELALAPDEDVLTMRSSYPVLGHLVLVITHVIFRALLVLVLIGLAARHLIRSTRDRRAESNDLFTDSLDASAINEWLAEARSDSAQNDDATVVSKGTATA